MSQKAAVRTVTVLGALAVAMSLAFVASAGAQSPGLDQYVESIPGPGGPKSTDKKDEGGGGGDGGGDSSSSGPTIESSQLDALRSQGRSGERAAAALEATSGSSDSQRGSNGSGSNGDSGKGGLSDIETLNAAEANGKTPVEAVLGSIGGGSGIALPLILLAVLIGGLVIAARKRAGANSIDD
jgi:hypothetical protein